MFDELGIVRLDDVLHDLEGTRKAEGQCAVFSASEAEVIPWPSGAMGRC
jgi:hypothetical protein